MFAGVFFEEKIIFEVFQQQAVRCYPFLVIRFLRLELVDLAVEFAGFQKIVLVEYGDKQHEKNYGDDP